MHENTTSKLLPSTEKNIRAHLQEHTRAGENSFVKTNFDMDILKVYYRYRYK